ncbi:anti-repressor SinI family protein [Heyndrickxia ginsengihumi]|uniref:DNA-binding anti-repressor SinI n=1 Tax=Heyndrickxia ginsengihumi TaxID=363870 RepID=A0A6M0P6L0_9BACI|nr:anti-repressor SinI family protein [Heyndrickxia ginsengihumi]MBE6182921.1 DNA-binding anti-repressor SinI [Bacillus sp. (in: firmicutes)]MCM3022855.1 anti-repressor SinI family protein [Heyndrickxia ginsengihumi]NEY20123.1 DNA-binding anti-repressor SinI [Heyndrickxia ginsengihumi]
MEKNPLETEQSLDSEWVELILSALNIGLTVNDIQVFLRNGEQ